jgi:hypothetical protein
MLTGEYGRHARLIVWKPWVKYTGTDIMHVTRRGKLTETLSWMSLFIPSRSSTRRSRESPAGGNPQGRSAEKVKLLLNSSHLAPQCVSCTVIMGMMTWSSRNTTPRETQSPPSWGAKCQSGFMTLPPAPL